MLNHRVARRVVIIEIDSDVTVAAGGLSHARASHLLLNTVRLYYYGHGSRTARTALFLSCWSSSDEVLGLHFVCSRIDSSKGELNQIYLIVWLKTKKKIRIGTDIRDVLILSSESPAGFFLVRFSKI